jgi:ATP-dependent Clp protease ATP-binding subunit ClpA
LCIVFSDLSEPARGCPATECFSYDTRFGARPFWRLIENEIVRVLADELLFGKLAKGGKVKVDLAGKKLVFDYGDLSIPVTAGPA